MHNLTYEQFEDQEVTFAAENDRFEIHYRDKDNAPQSVGMSIEAAQECLRVIGLLLDRYEQEEGEP